MVSKQSTYLFGLWCRLTTLLAYMTTLTYVSTNDQ